MSISIAERYRRRSSHMRLKTILSKEMLQKIATQDAVITNYLTQRNVPEWFRGTSEFQMKAAQELQNAIRDDTEQRTTHRVRECLMVIGLDPVIAPVEAKILMRLSRGNDLAFLWFLLEMCYKTDSTTYSVNEQLIMSSIAHLDMITTLRELDRILPPPEMSKKVWDRRRHLEELQMRSIPVKRKPKQHASPYFHKLVRPRHYGKSLTVPMPDFKLNFGYYDRYKDPDYIVPNEHNRWYADYEMQPGKRIVHRILSDAVQGVFGHNAHRSVDHKKILCEHHKAVKEMEETLEAELRVLARDKCLAYCDVNKRRQDERQDRISKALERDVQRYMDLFRKMAAKTKRQIMVMSMENEADCQYHLVDLGDFNCVSLNDEYSDAQMQRHSMRRISHLDSHFHIESTRNKCNGDCSFELGSNDSELSYLNRQSRPSRARVSIAETLIKTGGVIKRGGHINDMSAFEGCDNWQPARLNTPTPSETYFEATTDHKPYLFNYQKIFTFKSDDNTDTNRTIQQALVKALNNEEDITLYEENSHYNINLAVRDCAEKEWCTGMKVHKAEIARQSGAEKEIKLDGLPQNCALEKDPLHYNLDYIDPDDKQLMEKLLRDGIDTLKKNPKFVLCSLPEAYKTPLLKEWIKLRYGKTYTRDELTKSYEETLKIFKALEKAKLHVRVPSTRELGSKVFIDYSCRHYLLKKANHLKRQYYKRVSAAIMEQARIFWFAMRPYLCSSGPPRNTYFAYMPAGVRDVLHFRIWQPSEYMNAKAEWDRRQMRKRLLK